MKRLIPIVILLALAIAGGFYWLCAPDEETRSGQRDRALRQH